MEIRLYRKLYFDSKFSYFFFIIINFVRSLVVKISYLAFKDVKIIVEIGKATPTCKSMGL